MVLSKIKLNELVRLGMVCNKHQDVVVDVVSICLHLDDKFTSYCPYSGEPFTPPRTMEMTMCQKPDGIILPPQGKILACSQEEVKIPLSNMGFVQTKGSIARGFLFTHMCDGQVDPGYHGKITLELYNASDFYYKLVPGMPIASLFVFSVDGDVTPEDGYNGRFQNASYPTAML